MSGVSAPAGVGRDGPRLLDDGWVGVSGFCGVCDWRAMRSLLAVARGDLGQVVCAAFLYGWFGLVSTLTLTSSGCRDCSTGSRY